MQLTVKQHPHTQKTASDTFVVPAGKTLTVETSPGGEEILSAVVPAGKSWLVTVVIDVSETDA